MKLIAAIRRFPGVTQALFRGQQVPEEHSAATIALSRAGGSCLTPLPTLHDHDGHSPAWADSGDADHPKDVANLPIYIERICQDAVAILGGPSSIEVFAVGDDGKVAGKPKDHEELDEAVAGAIGLDGHAAIVLTWPGSGENAAPEAKMEKAVNPDSSLEEEEEAAE